METGANPSTNNGSVYFSVHRPAAEEIPVVVEIPHAGLYVDPQSLATIAAPARCLGQDADLYVDELYAHAPMEGATVLAAHVSRYVCDLNRSESDVDGLAVYGGTARSAPHGLIWRTTTDDVAALVSPLSEMELNRRLDRIYRPYHRTLEQLIAEKKDRFGFAILLCAHSMPSRGRAGHADPGQDRADVVPGTRSRTTAAAEVIEVVEHVARSFAWTIAHDTPYRGGYSTAHYGQPAQRVHTIQIELARRLYMDERTLAKKADGFERTRRFCRTVVARLGQLGLA